MHRAGAARPLPAAPVLASCSAAKRWSMCPCRRNCWPTANGCCAPAASRCRAQVLVAAAQGVRRLSALPKPRAGSTVQSASPRLHIIEPDCGAMTAALRGWPILPPCRCAGAAGRGRPAAAAGPAGTPTFPVRRAALTGGARQRPLARLGGQRFTAACAVSGRTPGR